MKTRVIHLQEGQDRAVARNLRTAVMIGKPQVVPGKKGALEVLADVWRDVRAVITSLGAPGVAVVAVDTQRGRVAGSMCIAAKPGMVNAGIVGRHGHCDLFLEGDGALSLRHLVVVVDPLTAWDGPAAGPGWDVRYRLIDLRTSGGFRDEGGRQLEAATVEGPAFVFIGRYALYCFPTGAADAWPDDPRAAIAALPERLYSDERDAEPDRWRRGRHAHKGRDQWAEGSKVEDPEPFSDRRSSVITRVTSVSGPSRARVDELGEGDELLGMLEVQSRLGSDSVRVGAGGADRGLLLGRYSRCDTAGATSLSLEKISRVHLLVVRIGDDLWAIDTASTNGVATGGAGVRVHRLQPGDELSLADGVGAVRWRPVH
ncbi:MAG: FHA domain-containing protein [Kofleriaceae bacterium]|nr:MAG: FHA domain-containing protein [Kofleriaceae bacterium]MBZ0235894.1 FHA domain-containing protein [Kofleriaceae bacterium]